jgi:hypothetical protein
MNHSFTNSGDSFVFEEIKISRNSRFTLLKSVFNQLWYIDINKNFQTWLGVPTTEQVKNYVISNDGTFVIYIGTTNNQLRRFDITNGVLSNDILLDGTNTVSDMLEISEDDQYVVYLDLTLSKLISINLNTLTMTTLYNDFGCIINSFKISGSRVFYYCVNNLNLISTVFIRDTDLPNNINPYPVLPAGGITLTQTFFPTDNSGLLSGPLPIDRSVVPYPNVGWYLETDYSMITSNLVINSDSVFPSQPSRYAWGFSSFPIGPWSSNGGVFQNTIFTPPTQNFWMINSDLPNDGTNQDCVLKIETTFTLTGGVDRYVAIEHAYRIYFDERYIRFLDADNGDAVLLTYTIPSNNSDTYDGVQLLYDLNSAPGNILLGKNLKVEFEYQGFWGWFWAINGLIEVESNVAQSFKLASVLLTGGSEVVFSTDRIIKYRPSYLTTDIVYIPVDSNIIKNNEDATNALSYGIGTNFDLYKNKNFMVYIPNTLQKTIRIVNLDTNAEIKVEDTYSFNIILLNDYYINKYVYYVNNDVNKLYSVSPSMRDSTLIYDNPDNMILDSNDIQYNNNDNFLSMTYRSGTNNIYTSILISSSSSTQYNLTNIGRISFTRFTDDSLHVVYVDSEFNNVHHQFIGQVYGVATQSVPVDNTVTVKIKGTITGLTLIPGQTETVSSYSGYNLLWDRVIGVAISNTSMLLI